MKKPVVRLGLGLAVVGLVVLWWQFGDEFRANREGTPEKPGKKSTKEAARSPYGEPAKTRTPLERHRALRELERTIDEGNKGGALLFRQKVAEDLTNLVKDKELLGNLLALIREKGFGADVVWQREVLIPLLRAIDHPEATKMIREGYYQARTESERRVLLEAMARQYHDPELASEWAIDVALHDESAEMREFAFTAIELHSGDEDLIARTAIEVFRGTTRHDQAEWMLQEASRRAMAAPSAIQFIRERLQTPRSEELQALLQTIEGWGTEKDARHLEALSVEFPEHGFHLRDQAIAIRRMLQSPLASTEHEKLEEMRIANEKAREAERKEQERKEREAKETLALSATQPPRKDEDTEGKNDDEDG